MLSLVTPVKSLFNKRRETYIDNNVFKLHYIVSTSIFLTFSVIFWAKEFVGEPIYCLGDPKIDDEALKAINSYCWVTSTYSVNRYFRPENLKNAIYPGVGPLNDKHSETTYHRYYLWTSFFHLFLALLFYLPRYLWKSWEGGRLKMLKSQLDSPIIDPDVKSTRLKILTSYCIENLGHQNVYAFKFFTCEVLNFFIVLSSFLFTDKLLGHQFATYGRDVVNHWNNNGLDKYERPTPGPMTVLFPKLTKCEFKKYGPTGNEIPLDIICVLTINNVNDKIFLFMWFYLIILGVISGTTILFRLISTVLIPRARVSMLKYQSGGQKNAKHVEFICSKAFVGDWFVLHQLSKNIDMHTFSEFIEMFAIELGNKNFEV